MVVAYGCIYEEHSVTTEDGFVLKLFRINSGEVSSKKKPVFLQHGLFADAETWVINKENSLAFVLAKKGYDVWAGNNRGTQYGRENVHNISPVNNKAEYFNYSFFELGKLDAPVMIDYVIKATGYPKISYVGHSQGTSQMFTALSYNFGDLQDKLDIFIACAPIVNLQHSPNKMMQAAAGIWNDIRIFAHLMGVYELLDPATDKALYKLCRGFYSFCEGLHDMLSLGKPEWNDEERLAVKHLRPATGAAGQEVLHYA